MSINAVVLDFNLDPIFDDMQIEHDDYSAAERFAEHAAENGIKCCIEWTRSEDGQTAYWGPSGATFDPHWYVRAGRLTPDGR